MDIARMHLALWSTLPVSSLARVGSVRHSVERLSVVEVLETLTEYGDRVPRPILLFALHNLLRNEAVRGHRDLARLAKSVLGQDVAHACRTAESRPRGSLPPDPGHVILESLCQADDDGEVATAVVDASVRVPLDKMRRIADLRVWGDISRLFWSDVGVSHDGVPARGGWAGVAAVALHLPHHSYMRLELDVDVTVGPFEVRTDFSLRSCGQQIDVLYGFLRLGKERGRPGVTRVTQQRTLRFVCDCCRDARHSVLTYWLQAETLCQLLGPSIGASNDAVNSLQTKD